MVLLVNETVEIIWLGFLKISLQNELTYSKLILSWNILLFLKFIKLLKQIQNL